MTMSTDDTGRDSKLRAPAFMRKALIAYAGVCALFFWPVLLPDRVLFGSDFLMFFYPMKQFLWEQVRDHGRLPLWNPHVFCGAPFLADIQVSAIYPGGALFYAMPPEQAYGWTVALHFFAAALGMFAFTRDFGLSWPASWTAGGPGHPTGHAAGRWLRSSPRSCCSAASLKLPSTRSCFCLAWPSLMRRRRRPFRCQGA